MEIYNNLKRIAALIKKNQDLSHKQIETIIMADFHKFRGTQPQIDDVTLTMLKYT